LAALGYDCRWTVLGAADVGAPHQRDRFWLVAHANSLRELQPQGSISDQWRRVSDCGAEVADAERWGLQANGQCGELGTPSNRQGGAGHQFAAIAGRSRQPLADSYGSDSQGGGGVP
jgi:DNA (cytosine-5)-methyltransferase 1